MAEPGGIRASDDDRDAAAGVLADAVAAGRLSLAEHSARLDALYAAATEDQVSAVIADVPAGPVSRGAFFRAFDPYRCVLIGGHARRTGRFRIGSFCTLVAAFGDLELDLRAAQLSQEEITLTVCSLAARPRRHCSGCAEPASPVPSACCGDEARPDLAFLADAVPE